VGPRGFALGLTLHAISRAAALARSDRVARSRWSPALCLDKTWV